MFSVFLSEVTPTLLIILSSVGLLKNTTSFLLQIHLWQLIPTKCLLPEFATSTWVIRVERPCSFFFCWSWIGALRRESARARKMPFLLMWACRLHPFLPPFFLSSDVRIVCILKKFFLTFSGHKENFKRRECFFGFLWGLCWLSTFPKFNSLVYTSLWAHEWPSSPRSTGEQPWP